MKLSLKSERFSVHNIDSIINSAQREIQEFKNNQSQNTFTQTHLLHAFAQRENDRLQNAPGKAYETTIVNADDKEGFAEPPAKANNNAEEKFSSVFNTVYADGALKINVTGDPSTLNIIIITPLTESINIISSMPTLSENVDSPLR